MTNSTSGETSAISTGLLGTVSRTILIAVLMGWSAVTLATWWTALRQTGDLDYAEGWLTYVAQQAVPGGDHVGAARALPHNVLPWPPLGYMLNGLVGRLFGDGLHAIRTAGHCATLTLTLCSAALIILLARVLNVRWTYAIFVAIVFLNLRSIQLFAVSLRPDALALALTLLAVYLALRFDVPWASGIALALAVFAKHSYVSIPIVFLAGYAARREWKALYALVAGGAITGLLLVWLSLWVMGPHWLDGPLLQGFHGAKPAQVLYLMYIACRGAALPLAVGFAAVAVPGLSHPARFLYAATAVSFILNVIAMVKPGASMNYLLEPTAFALILTAFVLERTLPSLTPRGRSACWLVAPLALSLLPGLESLVALRSARADAADAEHRATVTDFLRGIDGPILATESWMYFESNHDPQVCPADLVSAAVEAGIISEEPILNQLRGGYFSAIAISASARGDRPFPKSWSSAIEQNYAVGKTLGSTDVYLPKSDRVRKAVP